MVVLGYTHDWRKDDQTEVYVWMDGWIDVCIHGCTHVILINYVHVMYFTIQYSSPIPAWTSLDGFL